jgi:hypothetical protein
MGYPAGHTDQIERPLSRHLVGDRDGAAPCVARFRLHAASVGYRNFVGKRPD